MPPSPARPLSAPLGTAARRTLACVAILAATIGAYHNSFRGAFVFDDQGNVIDNPSLHHLWPPTSWFAAPVNAGVAGRPLANLTLAINYAVSGLDVWSYHALNLAIHALSALVLFGVARRTLLSPTLRARCGAVSTPLALLGAVLWLVHPLATGTVDYVSQRTELLAALFQLLTLYGFARATACHPDAPQRAWLAWTIGACALGMACKETAVTTPLLVLLYDRAFVAETWRAVWRARGGFYCALASTWIVLGTLIWNSALPERGVGLGLGVSWLGYALTECSAYLHYLRLAVWPAPLVFDYGWVEIRNATAVVGLFALVGVVAVGLWRRRAWAFGGACFLALPAPASTFVPVIQQPIAENRVYLALAGVVLLAVLSLHVLLGRRLWPVVAVLAIVGCSLTLQRNFDYVDEITLWTDTVVKRPANARAHNNLSGPLLLAGHADEALLHALAALQLRPDYPDAHTNAGGALVQLGRAAEAIPHFEAVLEKMPKSAVAHYNLANGLLLAGRSDEAITQLEIALRLDPLHVQAHNDLGVALLQVGRVADAIAHESEAVRLAPQRADARYNLGNALAQAGRLPDAIDQLTAATRLKPDFAQAHNNLGTVLLRAGRRAEAIEEFETALRVRPGYAQAERNLETAQQAPTPQTRLSPNR